MPFEGTGRKSPDRVREADFKRSVVVPAVSRT
jgi:hypothetical protein